MKYKVGNKVRIKSLDWYNKNKNEDGDVNCGSQPFIENMIKFCGKTLTISQIDYEEDCYFIEEDDKYAWTDEMIEGLVEEHVFTPEKDMKWTTEYLLPDGYIFKDENGNIINSKKIVLEKKKKEYPKTYEECLKVLSIEGGRLMFNNSGITQYERELYLKMNNLSKLLICRDAYWKIAGDWKPDWAMYSGLKHCIIYSDNEIKWQGKHFVTEAKVLAFPISEMRDAFYENFEDLIEQCKELL